MRFQVAVCVAALLLAGGQIVLRRQHPPGPLEAIAWERLTTVPDPPYDRPLLLDFSAEWCIPCFHMKLTTFRDPGFAALVRQLGLRPIRLEEERTTPVEFSRLMARYSVSGIPALVVVSKDGWHYPAVIGERTTEEVSYSISMGARRANRGLRWSRAMDSPLGNSKLPIIRNFDSWFFLEKPPDWRQTTRADFVRWANANFVLVDDEFASRVRGTNYFRNHGIRSVPTVTLELPGVGEVARFEGAHQVEGAPRRMVEILKERGFPISAPPDDD